MVIVNVKLFSWNVNGIRATLKKEIDPNNQVKFEEWLVREKPAVVCLQETKAHREQLPKSFLSQANYSMVLAEPERKGYSGVATLWRNDLGKPKHTIGLGEERFDREGRTIISEFDGFTLINVYVPNGKKNAERLRYKMDFKAKLTEVATSLVGEGHKVLVTGDINTAHQAIDLARPKENEKISGFLPEEREWISSFLVQGFVDTFRHIHPDAQDRYSWWSVRTKARERNVGWRIDYFYASTNLVPMLVDAEIHDDLYGSDHCPISVTLDL